jgi:hypothetical protein
MPHRRNLRIHMGLPRPVPHCRRTALIDFMLLGSRFLSRVTTLVKGNPAAQLDAH